MENLLTPIVEEPTIRDVMTLLLKMQEDISGLKSDSTSLKTNVAILQTDVSNLQTDVSGLRAEMREMRVEFNGRFEKIEKELVLLRTDMDEGFAIVAHEFTGVAHEFTSIAHQFTSMKSYIDEQFTHLRNKFDRHIQLSEDEQEQMRMEFGKFEQVVSKLRTDVDLFKAKQH